MLSSKEDEGVSAVSVPELPGSVANRSPPDSQPAAPMAAALTARARQSPTMFRLRASAASVLPPEDAGIRLYLLRVPLIAVRIAAVTAEFGAGAAAGVVLLIQPGERVG